MRRAGPIGIVIVTVLASLSAAGNSLPLIDAVKAGNVETVRALIKQRVDVNAASPDGTTALHWAVKSNSRELAQVLIAAGAKANAANRYGVTPLTLAATNGNAALAEALLKAGANPNVTVGEGETILMTAARAGNVETIKALVAHGADVNAVEQWQGQTALVYAAVENHADAVRVLVELGANVNVRSKKLEFPDFVFKTAGMIYAVQPVGSWTPLMYAARDGAVDAVRALAAGGADLNLVDPDGTTALTLAIINGHFDTAVALLEKGADPNVADIKGMTPLYAAVDMHTIGDTFGRPYPAKPVIDGSLDAARVLIKGGADVNARLTAPVLKRVYDAGDSRLGEGATPFMRAARKCDVEMMRILLDAKADVTLAQKSGNTPLMLCAGAVSGGNSEDTPERVSEDEALAAIRLALDAGVDVNAQNATGDTALHTAATSGGGQPAIIRLLVDRGARLGLKNNADRTPLDAAVRARQPNQAAIALLKELAAR